MPKTTKHSPPQPDDVYMTADEVASLMRVSRQTVVRLFKTGEIKAKKIGSLWRCSRAAVNTFMSSHDN